MENCCFLAAVFLFLKIEKNEYEKPKNIRALPIDGKFCH